MSNILRMGLDVGSTTVKLVVVDDGGTVVHTDYRRHYADTRLHTTELLQDAYKIVRNNPMTVMVTGSAGISISSWLGVQHIQEVIACNNAIERLIPQTDVAIELGGEDAKITFFRDGLDQRMNGICAGGTGAFIDQMATLLGTDTIGLNNMARQHSTIYPVAARCGVLPKLISRYCSTKVRSRKISPHPYSRQLSTRPSVAWPVGNQSAATLLSWVDLSISCRTAAEIPRYFEVK